MIITRELLEKQIQEYTEASLEAKGTMIANDGAAQALKLLLPLLDTHEVVDE